MLIFLPVGLMFEFSQFSDRRKMEFSDGLSLGAFQEFSLKIF